MTHLRHSHTRAVRVLGGLCLVASVRLVAGQSPSLVADRPCAAGLLQDPGGCVITLVPGPAISVSLAIAEGKVRLLTVEQLDGNVELRVSPANAQAGDPHGDQAGVGSHIPVMVAHGEQITISNASKDRAAKIALTAGAERAEDASAELERAAEKAFAHAELLRTRDTHDQAAAIAGYDDAIAKWQSAGNQMELARALIWKADFLINSGGDAPLALPVLERATPMLPHLDPAEAAHYWQVLAFIHVVRGEYDVVQDAYRRSLALYAAVGDSSHQAKVLDNSARVELMEGHSDVALADERRASELATAAGDTRRLAFVQDELGAIYATAGDSESAYRAYGEALQALKRLPPEPRMETAIWVDFSDLYITLGDFARAKDSLDQATAISKTTDYSISKTDTLNNYGDLYLVKGSPREARKYFERGLALAKSVNYERGSIALMSGLGDSYLYEHDTAHAEQVLEDALARASKAQQTDSEMQIHCQLGDLALLKHDAKAAGQQYAICNKEALEAHDAYTQIRAEGGLARTALEGGELQEGETHAEKALGMIEATRGELRNQNLKTTFFASQHSYYDLDIQILERLDQMHPQEGYAWRAFLVAERARARTLLDQLTAADKPTGATPALLALYEEVQRRLRKLEAAPKSNEGGKAVAELRRARIEGLTMSEHQLYDEIATAGEVENGDPPAHPLTLASLQDALPERHAVLLEYWTGEKASFAWSITRTGIHSFRLPPVAELTRQCQSYRKTVLSSVSTDPTLTAEQRAALQTSEKAERYRLGLRLSSTLLPRDVVVPGTTTVFLVSDGPVESLPFAALGLERGVDFLNEPSATIFSLLETHVALTHRMRVAVFADEGPSIKGPASEVRLSSTSGSPREFADLPFAGDEAAMIRTTMGEEATQLFPAAQVSRNTLQALPWNEFSIGHFAMHAVLNEQYAELSGLALGQEHGAAANFLWYGDVCHLHTRLDLVVLSACNTSLGAQVPGEGLRGLTQAFFAAGSQRVLGTLWQVDDQATSEWMRHFYQSLKATHSPVEALHDTQRAMAADPQWSSPYYWAGFVLSGDWRPLPQ